MRTDTKVEGESQCKTGLHMNRPHITISKHLECFDRHKTQEQVKGEGHSTDAVESQGRSCVCLNSSHGTFPIELSS
jgi:hypothetical protein